MQNRIADLATLWKQASLVFPYFGQRALNWDAVFEEFLPKVMAAETPRAFHLHMAEFLNRLGDGHTDYTFPRALLQETGGLPFVLEQEEDGCRIRAVAEEKREHLGARVIRLNGKKPAELIREGFRYVYHTGEYVYPSRLQGILPFLLSARGNRIETEAGSFSFELTAEQPVMAEEKAAETSDSWRPASEGRITMRLYEGRILYIALPDLLYADAAREIAAALNRQKPAGVILDLRQNIGGMTAYGARIAELFIPGQFHACQKWTRIMKGVDLASASQLNGWSEERLVKLVADGLCGWEEIERDRAINRGTLYEEYTDCFGQKGQAAVFDGPCYLLTSRNTISAAEDMTAMFRSNQRGRILGDPTFGSTGTPLLASLRTGGHARICSVGYRLLDGTEFIGCGIQPDPWHKPARQPGRDTWLETAVADMQAEVRGQGKEAFIPR